MNVWLFQSDRIDINQLKRLIHLIYAKMEKKVIGKKNLIFNCLNLKKRVPWHP